MNKVYYLKNVLCSFYIKTKDNKVAFNAVNKTIDGWLCTDFINDRERNILHEWNNSLNALSDKVRKEFDRGHLFFINRNGSPFYINVMNCIINDYDLKFSSQMVELMTELEDLCIESGWYWERVEPFIIVHCENPWVVLKYISTYMEIFIIKVEK